MQSYCGRCNIHIHTRHLFSPGFSLDDAVVVAISEASFLAKNRTKSTESLRTSNHIKLVLGNALNAEKMLIHLVSWSSTRIRRVCRSTLMTLAFALSNAVQHGLQTRASNVDMRGQLNIRQWEENGFCLQRDTSGLQTAKVSLRI